MKDPDDDAEMITLIENEGDYEGTDLEPGVVTNSMIVYSNIHNWLCP